MPTTFEKKSQVYKFPDVGGWGGFNPPLVPRLSKPTDRTGVEWVQGPFGARAAETVILLVMHVVMG